MVGFAWWQRGMGVTASRRRHQDGEDIIDIDGASFTSVQQQLGHLLVLVDCDRLRVDMALCGRVLCPRHAPQFRYDVITANVLMIDEYHIGMTFVNDLEGAAQDVCMAEVG